MNPRNPMERTKRPITSTPRIRLFVRHISHRIRLFLRQVSDIEKLDKNRGTRYTGGSGLLKEGRAYERVGDIQRW